MQLAKAERHRLIESVVSRKRVGTQFELLDALAGSGCSVTQATVSRDIRELGLEKTHDQLGRPRYVPSEQVGAITEGQVQLTISKDQTDRLGEYEEAATSAEILPEEAGALRRADASVEAPIHPQEERLNLLTRIQHALRRLFNR